MMRLRQLTLDFFGQFTGKNYDFGAGGGSGSDFHLIYGPNEAGKTTTMEAYLRLLYGFPPREPYDFQHQRKNLRVSGVLEIDGEARAFSRLPTRAGSLIDGNGGVLPDNALQIHLGGLSLEDYRKLLCLDDETIEKGGEEITSSKGDIGQLLFSAAAGISGLTKVFDDVKARADGLYRKRASSTEFAALKKAHAEIESRLKELDVPASAYRRLKQAVEQAQAEEASIREQRAALFKEESRLGAMLKGLPALEEIGELDSRLAPFASYPARLDINPEDLVSLLTERGKAAADAERLRGELERLRAELAGISVELAHLQLGETLQTLDSLRSRYGTAALDLDRRRKQLDEKLEDMRRAARELGVDDTADLGALVVPPAMLAELETAREQMTEAARRVDTERGEIDSLTNRISTAAEACGRLEAEAPAGAQLPEILQRFDVDALAARHAAARQAVEQARDLHSAALDALTIRGQRFDTVPDFPLASEEVEDRVARLAKLGVERENAEKALEELALAAADRKTQIEQIRQRPGVTSDEDALGLRARRDDLWSEHKRTLSEASAEAFEAAMIRVDAVMEGRLSHARDIAQLRQLDLDLATTETKAAQIRARLDTLRETQERMLAELDRAAATAGLTLGISSEALLSWVRRHEAASAAERTLHRLQDAHAETFAAADRLVAALTPLIARETPEFDSMVREARRLETAQRHHRENLLTQKTRLTDLRRDHAQRGARLVDLQSGATATRERWEALIRAAFSGLFDPHQLAASLQPLHDLRELEKDRSAIQRQVDAMEADQAQFRLKVEQLAERTGLAPEDTPLATYQRLASLFEAARSERDRADQLAARIGDLEAAEAEAQRRLRDIGLEVRELSQVFATDIPTETLEDLRRAVDETRGAITLRDRREAVRQGLLTELGVSSLEAAREALAGARLSELQSRLAEVRADIDAAEARYRTAIETRTSSEKDLRAVTGDADVARLEEEKATIELEMTDVALRHLELSLGHQLAEEAIRRYRDTHRSAMMASTESAFADLTNGAYRQLRTQPNGGSETLVAIDAAGTPKQAQDMSKGTRFQLYLALRAAAYEQLAAQKKCLPFFCDDVFETFDEERTASACRIMERIGRSGQAIYLTHHRHVVDIAQQICGDNVHLHSIN